ncbi:5'-nucleotidase surE [Desulfamplus magnetovallimortis]|uniref:5'-nucleotidase SurE n=1 Tax=Desulfamplus magnetovallimortis TaxID=1246637 RepID=A0A1W1H6Z2_9BACT|nr:5'/3'-nucleotidase SurE [Desulfamplus magnetovallimortis]SLM28196.1 5'-nucleotidase surE [Desulfamplus magnetovallimortis]
MNILLTNDDGYLAPGIRALYEQFRYSHKVTLVAPDRERSAVGHGITLHEPLRMKNMAKKITAMESEEYSVTGTPADCVKLALFELYETPPDLVISGVNAGSNTGVNINYSGTAGAAREAAINGVPAIAVSIKRGDIMDYTGMARFIDAFASQSLIETIHQGTFLNINAPAINLNEVLGIKITRQATRNVSRRFKKETDPRGHTYYWYDCMDPVENEPETDDAALEEHYISVTPIQCDLTNHLLMTKLDSYSIL